MRDHSGEVEADFQRYYGLNLGAEIASGAMSLRRCSVLAVALPTDGALSKAMGIVWSDLEHMTALHIEVTHAIARMVSGDKKMQPLVIPRPGETPAEPEVVSLDQAFLMFGGGE